MTDDRIPERALHGPGVLYCRGRVPDLLESGVSIDNREVAAAMAASHALLISNHPRCVPGAPARFLARWIGYDHALDDAEHLLRSELDETDPTSLDALHLVNALAAIASAQELGGSA